ncbi:MAG: hypothetical protein EOP55_00045 [Sphingobacteriales bacterium]|nr:MAG: hypothetical protein EOP55_00045 [Sphingobacteriales bacterium]
MFYFTEATLQALEFIRHNSKSLPGVSEKLLFETPAFYVAKKIFARIHEDGENLVLYTEDRALWMSKDPKTYFITQHYENYKYMLVNLERVDPTELKELLKTAWLKRATKTLIKQL